MTAPVDAQAEYDNRARVPEHPAIIAGWQREAAAFRDVLKTSKAEVVKDAAAYARKIRRSFE